MKKYQKIFEIFDKIRILGVLQVSGARCDSTKVSFTQNFTAKGSFEEEFLFHFLTTGSDLFKEPAIRAFKYAQRAFPSHESIEIFSEFRNSPHARRLLKWRD